MADRTNRPSKVRVNRSEEPPPPPPPRPPDEDELELELLELELELELDELPPGFVGVVPDVTGASLRKVMSEHIDFPATNLMTDSAMRQRLRMRVPLAAIGSP